MNGRKDSLQSPRSLRPGDPITSQYLVDMAARLRAREQWRLSPDQRVGDSAYGKSLQASAERGGFWAMITGYDYVDQRVTSFAWQEARYVGGGKWEVNPSGRSSYYEKNGEGKTILRQPAFLMSGYANTYIQQGTIVWLERNHGEKYFASPTVNDSDNLGQERAVPSERMIFDWHSGGCFTGSTETKGSPRVQFAVYEKGNVPRVYLPKQEDYPEFAVGVNLYISAVDSADGGSPDAPLYLYSRVNNLEYIDLIAAVDVNGQPPVPLDGNDGEVRESHVADPTTAPRVVLTGGGREGGNMLPGLYWVAYTFVDVPGWIDVTVSGCSSIPTSSSSTDGGNAFPPLSFSNVPPSPLGGVEVTLGKRGVEYLYSQMATSREVALINGFTLPVSPGLRTYNPTLASDVFPIISVGGTTPSSGMLPQIEPGTHYFVCTYLYDDGDGSLKESQPSVANEYSTDGWGVAEFQFFPKIGGQYIRDPKIKAVNVYASVFRGSKTEQYRIISEYAGNYLKYYGPIPLPPAPPRRNETGTNFNVVYPYRSRTPIVADAFEHFYYWNYPIQNPTIAAMVDPQGYGDEGGSLEAGTYSLRYTFVGKAKVYDSLGQMVDTGAVVYGETEPGPLSAEFKIARKGMIPKVYLPPLPSGAVGYNIYITEHDRDGLVFIDKKTTDFNGKCYFNVRESGGAYEVYTSAPGFQDNSGYVDAIACQNNTIGISIKATAGLCCDGGCVEPLPYKFSMTDSNKTITLSSMTYSYRDVNNQVVYNKHAEWWGCYPISASGYSYLGCTTFNGIANSLNQYNVVDGPGKNVNSAIVYRLICPDGRRWKLRQYIATNGYVSPTLDWTGRPRWDLTLIGNYQLTYSGTYENLEQTCQSGGYSIPTGAYRSDPPKFFATDAKCVDVDSMFLNGTNWTGQGFVTYPAPIQSFQSQGLSYSTPNGEPIVALDQLVGSPRVVQPNEIYDAVGTSNQIPAYMPKCSPLINSYITTTRTDPATGSPVQDVLRDANGNPYTWVLAGAVTGVFSYAEIYSDNYMYYYPYNPKDSGSANDAANGRTTYTCRPVNLRFRFPSCTAVPGVVTVTEQPSS